MESLEDDNLLTEWLCHMTHISETRMVIITSVVIDGSNESQNHKIKMTILSKRNVKAKNSAVIEKTLLLIPLGEIAMNAIPAPKMSNESARSTYDVVFQSSTRITKLENVRMITISSTKMNLRFIRISLRILYRIYHQGKLLFHS